MDEATQQTRDHRNRGACRTVSAILLDALILLSLVTIPSIWMATPLHLFGDRLLIHWRPWLLAVPVALGIARAAVSPLLRTRGLWRFGIIKKLALAIGSTFFLFLSVEQILEFANIEYNLPPMVIRGREEAPANAEDKEPFIRDQELLWRYKPNFFWHGRSTSSNGFFSRSVSVEKPRDTIRVLCLGDSCTAQGLPTYPDILHEALAKDPPTEHKWEAFNMAVHGYSSAQGLRLFQMRGKKYCPDIVTFYFGWNDHWLIAGPPDHIRMAVPGSPYISRIYNMLRNKRFGQLLIKLIARSSPSPVSDDDLIYRVPLAQYRTNLVHFAEACREIGAIPIYVTAPRAPVLPRALVHRHQARSVEQAMAVHDEYIETTRQVATELHAPLVDLAEAFADPKWHGCFQEDGIHFFDSGRERIAARIYDAIADLAISNDWASQNIQPPCPVE